MQKLASQVLLLVALLGSSPSALASRSFQCLSLFISQESRPTAHAAQKGGLRYLYIALDPALLEAKLVEAKRSGEGLKDLIPLRNKKHGENQLFLVSTGRIGREIHTADGMGTLTGVVLHRPSADSPILVNGTERRIGRANLPNILVAIDPSVLNLGPWQLAGRYSLRGDLPFFANRPSHTSSPQDITEYFELVRETDQVNSDYYAYPDLDTLVAHFPIPLSAIRALVMHPKFRSLRRQMEELVQREDLNIRVIASPEFPDL